MVTSLLESIVGILNGLTVGLELDICLSSVRIEDGRGIELDGLRVLLHRQRVLGRGQEGIPFIFQGSGRLNHRGIYSNYFRHNRRTWMEQARRPLDRNVWPANVWKSGNLEV